MTVQRLSVEAIARICHEANRALCAAYGDTSQTSWEEAPDWQKQSAVAGVANIFKQPTTSAEKSHENWMLQKYAEGWKWGPVKDPDKKEHPAMVPYAHLPEEIRRKDRLFVAIVRVFLLENFHTFHGHPLPWKWEDNAWHGAAITDAIGDIVVSTGVADVSYDDDFISTMDMIVQRANEHVNHEGTMGGVEKPVVKENK